MRTIARFPQTLIRVLLIVCMMLMSPGRSGGGSGTTPVFAGSLQHAASLRYVVFVDGLFSKGDATKPLNGDFRAIKDGLATLGLSRFIYFSYGAAASKQAGGRYCMAWAAHSCADQHGDTLSTFDAQPIYTEADSKLSFDLQAAALNWLLAQIVVSDSAAQIDLVTFSVGGIIAARWASIEGATSPLASHVHTIVLIDAPAGGLNLASLLINSHSALYAAAGSLRGYFGRDVLAALQIENVPESIIRSLPRAARFFHVTSIQSTTDYLVNGVPLKVCVIVCLNVTFGGGTQSWGTTAHVRQREGNLGGTAIAPGRSFSLANMLDAITLTHLIYGNHSVTRSNRATVAWVAEAVASGLHAAVTKR